jgi:hypothetical protein
VSEALREKGRTAARSARLLVDPAVADANGAVNRAYFADYEPVRIDLGDAAELVGTAEGFVAAVEQFLGQAKP